MAQQSSSGGRPKLSERGLLTPDNCVVALIDHQPQMLFGVRNSDRQGIINSVIALAKATRVFELPVVLSTVETKSFSGNMVAAAPSGVSRSGTHRAVVDEFLG
jgi:nicotinamidase-related amidase